MIIRTGINRWQTWITAFWNWNLLNLVMVVTARVEEMFLSWGRSQITSWVAARWEDLWLKVSCVYVDSVTTWHVCHCDRTHEYTVLQMVTMLEILKIDYYNLARIIWEFFSRAIIHIWREIITHRLIWVARRIGIHQILHLVSRSWEGSHCGHLSLWSLEIVVFA